MRRKIITIACILCMTIGLLAGCGSTDTSKSRVDNSNTLVYGSGEYTRINPAIDEHGEINVLIFNGLTAHDEENNVVPSLAKDWTFDETTNTYTFNLEKDVKWHDGEKFTADDVKFTIEQIMDPANESEIASNYEDIEEIKVIDEYTIAFKLKEKNVAFTEYMTIGILPKHLLEGEDMQTSDFFRFPIGTGPYKMEKWDDGQSITLVKNDDYFKGVAKIDTIVFKFVTDDNAKALQLKSGELDLAIVTPKAAKDFADNEAFKCYDMITADYRGIMYNFNNKIWAENKAIIPAISYGINRQEMIDAVLLGEGEIAYGPLQRNIYNNADVEKYEYNQDKAKEIIQAAGWTMGPNGYYEKNGQVLGFTISCMEGDQVRIDLASIAAQQLKEIGINVKVEVPSAIDWDNFEAFLIGWGSPFDADDHTYKVFGTDKGSNYNGYSNEKVDEYLTLARESEDEETRREYYYKFQEELANDPAYTFFCYVDANYVANKNLMGITEDTVLGHHGVGIFWNVTDWTLEK